MPAALLNMSFMSKKFLWSSPAGYDLAWRILEPTPIPYVPHDHQLEGGDGAFSFMLAEDLVVNSEAYQAENMVKLGIKAMAINSETTGCNEAHLNAWGMTFRKDFLQLGFILACFSGCHNLYILTLVIVHHSMLFDSICNLLGLKAGNFHLIRCSCAQPDVQILFRGLILPINGDSFPSWTGSSPQIIIGTNSLSVGVAMPVHLDTVIMGEVDDLDEFIQKLGHVRRIKKDTAEKVLADTAAGIHLKAGQKPPNLSFLTMIVALCKVKCQDSLYNNPPIDPPYSRSGKLQISLPSGCFLPDTLIASILSNFDILDTHDSVLIDHRLHMTGHVITSACKLELAANRKQKATEAAEDSGSDMEDIESAEPPHGISDVTAAATNQQVPTTKQKTGKLQAKQASKPKDIIPTTAPALSRYSTWSHTKKTSG
ncbi:hypothetical protein K438DRAFT_1926236 [Mycena galopus ATCC 62051]|nr:hypothetical protein K438DRAFT_1926236 [Mycena galopus ATCC 62051]